MDTARRDKIVAAYIELAEAVAALGEELSLAVREGV